MSRRPVFLEKRSYRHRRTMDAVRMLPFLGLALWMMPLIWPLPAEAEGGIPMSLALRYLFGVWAFLILVCGVLWWRTRGEPPGREDRPKAADVPPGSG